MHRVHECDPDSGNRDDWLLTKLFGYTLRRFDMLAPGRPTLPCKRSVRDRGEWFVFSATFVCWRCDPLFFGLRASSESLMSLCKRGVKSVGSPSFNPDASSREGSPCWQGLDVALKWKSVW